MDALVFKCDLWYPVAFCVSLKTAFSHVLTEINWRFSDCCSAEMTRNARGTPVKTYQKYQIIRAWNVVNEHGLFGYAMVVIFRDKKSYYYTIKNKGFTRLNYISKVSSRIPATLDRQRTNCVLKLVGGNKLSGHFRFLFIRPLTGGI